ncbi:MAG: M14 family zinc carboxypeptidase [Bryobacteraceae bacterium]
MIRRWFFVWAAALCQAAVPTPKEHFGFTPGDDYKLAGYGQISGYFHKLAASSPRIRVLEFGKSSEGKPMYAAFISDAGNLRRLDRFREISKRLALGRASAEEARALAAEGRVIVWIDSGLHASEVAPAQHAPLLAYKMITEDNAEIDAVRRKVILIQIPCINPDGLDMIAHWYAKNVGTPYEMAPLPKLYQKYSGHDNNRDYFMLNLAETRNVTRMMYQEWFPQIIYNQHQVAPFPARIFVPPYSEPLNPNIPTAVTEGITLIGSAMKERFARENKPGVISYTNFDAWWNGGLRSAPAFHNMHGILTETAGYGYATPHTYPASAVTGTFGNGMPVREPSMFYPHPWLGGKWALRDAVEYMLTADLAILTFAAERGSDFLLKSWQMAQAAIEAGAKGKPYAYVLPPAQWDRSAPGEMLDRLAWSGVEVRRARAAFQAGGKEYPAGTPVMLTAQAFRPYLVDLMEPQKYPELRVGSSGPTKRPYDIAGWTLSMQMGVSVDRIEEPFKADLEAWSGPYTTEPALDHRDTTSFVAMARMLARGERVTWAADGAINSGKPAWELRPARVALYEAWGGNADQGWTQWVLDRFEVPYTIVHPPDFARGGLREKFDAVILASQPLASILHGARPARGAGTQRPEYTGGIGVAGAAELEKFVRAGGTLIAFDSATELPVQLFPVSVRMAGRGEGASQFYCPGSLVRMTVDTSKPLAFGMPKDIIAMTSGGTIFESGTAVANFAKQNLLASGWVSGEKAVLGKAALVEAPLGEGRVVLFGFRPQFRGQTWGTFKFLLNAVYLASARQVAK